MAGYSFSLYTVAATGFSGISLPLVVLHDSFILVPDIQQLFSKALDLCYSLRLESLDL